MSRIEISNDSSSTGDESTVQTRRGFLTTVTGLVALAGCTESTSIEYPPEIMEEVRDTIGEYRIALEACLKAPSQDTSETLNRASMAANIRYFTIQPDLKPNQKQDIGEQIRDLNDQAINAVNAVQPQTRYTQHYLKTIKDRKEVWTLQAKGDHKGMRAALNRQLESSEKNAFHSMPYDEQVKFMSEVVTPEK